MECKNLDQRSCGLVPGCEYNFDSSDSSGVCEKSLNIIDMARSGNIDEVVSFLISHSSMKKNSVEMMHKEALLLFEMLIDRSIDIKYALIMEEEDFEGWSGEFIKEIEMETPSSSAEIVDEDELKFIEQKRLVQEHNQRIMKERKERDQRITQRKSSPPPCTTRPQQAPGLVMMKVPFNQEQKFNGNRFTVREGGIIEYWSEKQTNFSNLTNVIKNTIFKGFFNSWTPKYAAVASAIVGTSVSTRNPMNGMYNDAIVVFVLMMFTLLMSFRIKYRSEINRRKIGTVESNVSTGYPVGPINKWF